MKKIKKFNESRKSDSMDAIYDSFNQIDHEIDLLNRRLEWYYEDYEDVEFSSYIAKMKINFDKFYEKWKMIIDTKKYNL